MRDGTENGGRQAGHRAGTVTIRILDTDGRRLALVERELRRRLRGLGIAAEVIPVGCGLEIARQGFAESCPALLVDQYVASAGTPLTSEVLEAFCRKLERWLALAGA